MKIIKRLITILLSIILFLSFQTLIISLISKDIIQRQLIDSTLKNELIDEYIEKAEANKIKEFRGILNDGFDEITNNIISDFLPAIENGKYSISDKNIDLIIKFLKKNQEKIKKVTGKELEINEIESENKKEELKELINTSMNEILYKFDSNFKIILEIYIFLTKTSTILFLGVFVIILSFVIMIINNSLFSGLNALGVAAIINSILTIFFYILFQLILKSDKLSDRNISINTTYVLIIGIVCFIIGVLSFIVKKNIRLNKKLSS